MFNLTLLKRNSEKKYSGLTTAPEKPRIKFLKNGIEEYIKLVPESAETMPHFSVYIDGVRMFLNDLDNWYNFERYINGISNLQKSGVPSTLKHVLSNGGFYHGCLAKNGKILLSPYNFGQFGMLDSQTMSIELFATCENITDKKGCCVAQNGKIYVFGTTTYEIDPDTLDVISFSGGLATSTNCLPGKDKDKKIYYASGASFVSFDPETKIFRTFPGIKYTTDSQSIAYSKEGHIVYNGKSNTATSGAITIFDTSTLTVTNIDTATYSGAVGATLATDLNIYFVPSTTTRISKLDTTTMSLTQIGVAYGSTKASKHVGFRLGKDGKLYSCPGSDKTLLIFDTTDETIVRTGSYNSTQSITGGGIVVDNFDNIITFTSSTSSFDSAKITFEVPNDECQYIPMANS